MSEEYVLELEHIRKEYPGVVALKDGVKVYLDVSLKRFETVFPAAGSSNSAIELTPDELFKISGALSWEDLCKSREN